MVIERHAGSDSQDPKRVLLGVFDVLGFKQKVGTTPIRELVSSYGRFLEISAHSAVVPVMRQSGVERWLVPSVIFSDTILLWADEEPEAADAFLVACADLVAGALGIGWAVRGGIAAGECVINRQSQLFLGEAIVLAYEAEQSQDWVGAGLHESCFSGPLGEMLGQHDYVARYRVPVKRCAQQLRWALRWVDRVHDPVALLDGMETREARRHRSKYRRAKIFARKFELGAHEI